MLTDLSAADQALVTVPPQRLVVGFLLSSEFLFSAAILVVALIVTAGFDVMAFALAGLIPLAIGLASMISRRVFQMFNFTLAQSARGVRVTRGLFNLTSQSIPVNRIQGVRVIQPILWRRLGWYRIDVNVLGYGSSEGSDNDTAATSVLVPVADGRDVEITLEPDPARPRPVRRRAARRRPGGRGGCGRTTSGPCATAPTTGSRSPSTAGSPTSATSSRTPRRSPSASARVRCSDGSDWPTSTSTSPADP